MTVYVSTGAVKGTEDLWQRLDRFEEAGIDAVELGAGVTLEPLDVQSLASCLSARGHRWLVHNYFPPPTESFVLNLASQSSDLLERSRAHCRAAIDLSAELSCPLYAAHAGYTSDVSPEVLGRPDRQAALGDVPFAEPETAYRTLAESARELTEYAAARNVRFLIENHVLAASAGAIGRRLVLMVRADELTRLCADVAHPNFGVLLDVGHLNVSATTAQFDRNAAIDTLRPHIRALHLSDNDGTSDQHRPFGEDAWFMPWLRQLPDAVVTVELAESEIGEILAVRDTVARCL